MTAPAPIADEVLRGYALPESAYVHGSTAQERALHNLAEYALALKDALRQDLIDAGLVNGRAAIMKRARVILGDDA